MRGIQFRSSFNPSLGGFLGVRFEVGEGELNCARNLKFGT